MKKRLVDEAMSPGMEEVVRLYHAWLGYLLRRLGEGTIRVAAGEIRRALEDFTCTVYREGEEYVICLDRGREEAEDGAEE